MAGRPDSGPVIQPLARGVTQGASDTLVKTVDVTGAKSVIFHIKVATGTPTVTIGSYLSKGSSRQTTLATDNLVSITTGATLAGGQSRTVNPLASAFATAVGPILMPVQKLDIQIAGVATGLDVQAVVEY